jgi:hypothetical protein
VCFLSGKAAHPSSVQALSLPVLQRHPKGFSFFSENMFSGVRA